LLAGLAFGALFISLLHGPILAALGLLSSYIVPFLIRSDSANIPVLVIKNEVSNVDFEVVAFACDFSTEAIEPYQNAMKAFNQIANLHIVHVNLPNDRFLSSLEIEKKAVNFFTKADGHLKKMKDVHYVCDYTIEDGVLNCANKIGADLIVVPTHGRKGLAHFFKGSISEDVANHSTLPVMTFKI
jgi:hypothetical protein